MMLLRAGTATLALEPVLACAPAGSVAKFDQVLPPSPDQKPKLPAPDQFATPAPAMKSGSAHAMSAALPLLQFEVGAKVGLAVTSVCSQVPISPALLMNLYGAPAGGVTSDRVAVSSILVMLPLQVGEAAEAFLVSMMPPPCTCRMWSRLEGSI